MQQQGGSRYGVPPLEMAAPFSSGAQPGPPPRAIRIPGGGAEFLQKPQLQQQAVAEEASPISSRPAPLHGSIFEEFGVDVGGSFQDEEAVGAGEESERAGSAGNRWPRQETLALLKIRSEMDAAFRDATVKGPLWDDVSRKLSELGYARSGKKCKEKFENVHKYYKRTKETRAGRQDGKSYRFFSQLEAIQSSGGGSGTATAALSPLTFGSTSFPTVTSVLASGAVASSSFVVGGSTMKAEPGSRIQPPVFANPGRTLPLDAPTATAAARISLSSNTSSYSPSDTDGDETEEGVAGAVGGLQEGGRKRKREGWPARSRKMMAFFDRLLKQVMERQELMQQRFFETIEKREQDRMIREEAWKRQEMARLNREYELMAQERAMATNRDTAIISFLEKLSSSPANHPPKPSTTVFAQTPPEITTSPASALPSSPQQHQKPPAPPPAPVELQLQLPAMEFERDNSTRNEATLNRISVSSEPALTTAAALSDMAEAIGGGSLDGVSPSSSSRWPKPEVLALIKLRSGLETRYLEAGPKGPLWEEISLEMKRLGYSRNAKRCKEKWENINKYFKKVKESNKKRPEDAKTCPYFHELDALYRKKQISGGGGGGAIAGMSTEQQQELAIANTSQQRIREPLRTLAPISGPTEQDRDNCQTKQIFMKSNIVDGGNHESTGDQIQRSNGSGIPHVFFGGPPNRGSGAAMKKPEDIIRELMEQQNHPHRAENDYDKLGHPIDRDTINHEYEDEDEDYDDDDEEDGKVRYEIQFQRQAVGAASASARAGTTTGKVATAASSAGSFLAMVQ